MIKLLSTVCGAVALAGVACAAPAFVTRGVILTPKDLSGTLDWPKLAHEAGLTTIATHIGPADVIPFLKSFKGEKFLTDCRKYGLEVEHELHAMGYLLPRDLFKTRPELFRVDKSGKRTAKHNCCVSSQAALEIIASNAVEVAKICRPTTGRYFYWLDDASDICHCPSCRALNASDQALVVENAILKALRARVDPKATLSHLAYVVTMVAPEKVKPAEGIFLEYANIGRHRALPICKRETELLKKLLEVFPVETAQVLEYWLDVSLYSRWQKPYARLPWSENDFRADVDDYAKMGFRRFTTFAVYMDDDYMSEYGFPAEVLAYGKGLAEWPYAEKPVREPLLVPGFVSLSKDGFGEDLLTLRSGGSEAVVSLRGAQIRSWKPAGQSEVLYCPPVMKSGGTAGVRGGITLCWPWFGRGGETGSLPCGFARHSRFFLSKCRADREMTRVDLSLDAPKRLPGGRLEYSVVLRADGQLEIEATTVHTGRADGPLRIAEGIRPYWRVSDRRQVRVTGLDGLAYRDESKTETENGAWRGDLVPGSRFDHVFAMKKGAVAIEDPGFNRRIAITYEGLPKLVVRTPSGFRTGESGNLPPEDTWKFVCAGPARLFKSDDCSLSKGEKRRFSVKIRCGKMK